MTEHQQTLDTLKDIRNIMDRSSRFISLSGWSGVAAGICALTGAIFAYPVVHSTQFARYEQQHGIFRKDPIELMDVSQTRPIVESYGDAFAGIVSSPLFRIAICTFAAAFISAFIFTYIKSKKQGIPIWGKSSIRLMVNVAIPLATGGIFVYRMVELGLFGMVAPACLVFYGLALLNASKYTFREIRYLGVAQLILGIINCWNIGYGLYFWAAGFGVLHIIYGMVMWFKYEKNAI